MVGESGACDSAHGYSTTVLWCIIDSLHACSFRGSITPVLRGWKVESRNSKMAVETAVRAGVVV